jgi:O-antigen/teichoic acid export membrane protein
MIKNKAIKDSFWNVSDYISSLVIFLITTKFFLDQIGVEGYGFYTFFTSLIGTFGLVDLGMGMVVSKYLSEFLHHKKYNEANQVVTIAFIFYIVIGLCLLLTVYVFDTNIINFLNFEEKFFDIGLQVLIVTCIIFIIRMILSIVINILVALEEWKTITFINIVMKIINAIILIYILTLSTSIQEKISHIFYLLLIFSIFKVFIYFIYAKKYFNVLAFSRPTSSIINIVMKFLKVSSFQYGLSFLSMHLDNFIVTKFFGLESMGIYTFARNAFFYIYGFLANIFKIFLPKLSKLHGDKNFLALKENFKKLLLYSVFASVILALVAVVTWKPFVSLYINEDFSMKSFPYMQIFALYLIARSLEPIFSYFFNAIAKPSVLVLNLVIGSICTIIGYFIFVPYLDIFGLVVSQIVASLIVYIYIFFLIKRKGFYEFTK